MHTLPLPVWLDTRMFAVTDDAVRPAGSGEPRSRSIYLSDANDVAQARVRKYRPSLPKAFELDVSVAVPDERSLTLNAGVTRSPEKIRAAPKLTFAGRRSLKVAPVFFTWSADAAKITAIAHTAAIVVNTNNGEGDPRDRLHGRALNTQAASGARSCRGCARFTVAKT